MRAITLTQPWATLVAIGAKKIETRSWSTSYRGPLLIHAAKGLGPVGGKMGLSDLCTVRPFLNVMIAHDLRPAELPLGAIVAVAELVDCVSTDLMGRNFTYRKLLHAPGLPTETEWKLTDQERVFGDYSPGRYGWLLANVRPLAQPVPCKGALSLWEPPTEVLAAVEAQL